MDNIIIKTDHSEGISDIRSRISRTEASINDIESFLATHFKCDDSGFEMAIAQLFDIAKPRITLNHTHHRRLRFVQSQRRCIPRNDGCEIDLEVAGLVKVHHPDPGSLCYGEVVLTQARLFELSRIREKKKIVLKNMSLLGLNSPNIWAIRIG